MLDQKANREDPDPTALFVYHKPFKQTISVQNYLFSNKMWIIKARIQKMLDRIANRDDPDQTASSEAVLSGSVLFV